MTVAHDIVFKAVAVALQLSLHHEMQHGPPVALNDGGRDVVSVGLGMGSAPPLSPMHMREDLEAVVDVAADASLSPMHMRDDREAVVDVADASTSSTASFDDSFSTRAREPEE
jgi:hypothetical protein